jgi:hypothetical protein
MLLTKLYLDVAVRREIARRGKSLNQLFAELGRELGR